MSLLDESRSTLRLAFPLMIGQVSQILLGVADTMMIGLPAAWWLAIGMGAVGVWWGLAVGLAASCVLQGPRLWVKTGKLREEIGTTNGHE